MVGVVWSGSTVCVSSGLEFWEVLTMSHGLPVKIHCGYGIDRVTVVGASGTRLDDLCSCDLPESVCEKGAFTIPEMSLEDVGYLNLACTRSCGWDNVEADACGRLAGGG